MRNECICLLIVIMMLYGSSYCCCLLFRVPDESRAAYVQYAVLHTTMSGVRRIRVVTLAVAVTNSLSTTFRYSEVESVLAYFVR